MPVPSYAILHVLNVRWFNATAWYGLRLAYLQQCAGYTVYIITIDGTDTHTHAKRLGIPTLSVNLNSKNPFVLLASLLKMQHILKKYRIHIVNCHRGESCILWGLLRMWNAFVLIRTRGDQRLPKTNYINTILHTKLIDAVIATNSFMYSVLKEQFALPQEKLALIIGGVDTQYFRFSAEKRALIRTQYAFSEQDCVFGILGRFDWVKGQREVLYALHHFYTRYPDARVKLLLLGFSSGIREEIMHSLIKKLHLEKHVYITGRCDDIPAYISALDVGLLSSLGSETISRAASEILVTGRPLLATDVGVLPDILPKELLIPLPKPYQQPKIAPSDTEQALTVDSDYIQPFYTAIQRYYFDVHYRQRLHEASRSAAQKLDEKDFFHMTATFYDATLQHSTDKGRCR